jgi:hypothetical protein
MIKLILTFVFVAAIIHFAITSWRLLSGLDKWALTKTLGYSIIVSALTVMLLASIVIIF